MLESVILRIYDALDVKEMLQVINSIFRMWQSGTVECLMAA